MNAFATAYYFNYLFFYLQKQFGMGNLGNLAFSAINGFVYVFSALYGGRFAQRRGYLLSLKIGFSGMAAALLAGLCLPGVAGQLIVLLIWTVSICFTWPSLEALVSDGEDSHRLPRRVGLYNMVWATGAALAFFSGGALMELCGWRSLFWLPAALHLGQLGLVVWLAREQAAFPEPRSSRCESAHYSPRKDQSLLTSAPTVHRPEASAEAGTSAPARASGLARRFLRMAWVANPLAYVAINTALPLIPDVARRLELSPMLAGFVCSAWMFARLAAFVLLWRWTGWHYRFGWLFSSYGLLILSFAGLLLAPYLWAVVLAQLVFGWSIGLIYYSSLFYSMDAGEDKGVHGGVHEAAIGLGIFTGPAVGALASKFFPEQAHASAWAVSGLLVVGLGLLAGVRAQSRGGGPRNDR